MFKDVEYREAGAVITNDLTAANTIFGVKEVPADNLIPGRNYVIFSHVIKAQPDNMPFLDACLAKNVRLFDYECIRDPATSTRLVAFGRFAGNAGMIDILRGCGHRFLTMGMSTPFLAMPSAYMHASLDQAKENVVAAGREVARVGLPKALTPLTFAFTGAGNVTQGAMDIFKLLPHEYVDVDDLAHLRARGNADPHKVYGVHLKTSDLVAPVERTACRSVLVRPSHALCSQRGPRSTASITTRTRTCTAPCSTSVSFRTSRCWSTASTGTTGSRAS